MFITATELKMNLSKYLLLADTQDIFFTKNGKVVAKITSPSQDKVETAKSLIGIIPSDISLEEIRKRGFQRFPKIISKRNCTF